MGSAMSDWAMDLGVAEITCCVYNSRRNKLFLVSSNSLVNSVGGDCQDALSDLSGRPTFQLFLS